VIKSYGAMPKMKITKLDVTHPASEKVAALQRQLDALHDKNITLWTTTMRSTGYVINGLGMIAGGSDYFSAAGRRSPSGNRR
jgi:hypothetical protein